MYYIFKSEKNVLYNIYSDLYYKSTLKSYIYTIKVPKSLIYTIKVPKKPYLYYKSIQINDIFNF